MKPERAQELYSDYAEGTLTPALRLALDQHFEADPSARADYARFESVYRLLALPPTADVEVPLGFRARVLERAAAEQATRETTFSHRAATTITGWFSAAPRRRMAGGMLAGLAAAALAGVLIIHPAQPVGPGPAVSSGSLGDACLGFGCSPAPNIPPAVIQQVELQPGQDSNTYHLFRLHLPATVPAATVSAYVVTATEQVTDPAHLGEATPALKAQHLTSHQGVTIPIAPAQAPPTGSTLNLLVQWTPDDTNKTAGAEVVFTPFGAADPATPAPAGANFLDAMQAVAAHYGATVVVDADAVPTQTITGDFAGGDAGTVLSAMAKSAGYAVQTLPNNTFYVYEVD